MTFSEKMGSQVSCRPIYLFQLEVFNAKLLSMQVTTTAILCLLYILPDPEPFIIGTAPEVR